LAVGLIGPSKPPPPPGDNSLLNASTAISPSSLFNQYHYALNINSDL
jgi:hypothetical protein